MCRRPNKRILNTFWEQTSHLILDSLNEACRKGELTTPQYAYCQNRREEKNSEKEIIGDL